MSTINQIVKALKKVTINTISETELDEIILLMDGDITETKTIAKDIFDPNGEQLTPDDSICGECLRGTIDEWIEFMMEEESWYNEYVYEMNEDMRTDEDPETEIPTLREWAVSQANEHTSAWDGDLDYKPISTAP